MKFYYDREYNRHLYLTDIIKDRFSPFCCETLFEIWENKQWNKQYFGNNKIKFFNKDTNSYYISDNFEITESK